MTENKIFFLDAYALIFRAYYAFIKNPRVNSKGLNTSAIFGFVNTLDDLLKKENPSHIGVVFDPPGPTFRHEQYSEYKANREATPEDIKLAVPHIKRILKAYNIPVVEVKGFEADDVIGTLATKAGEEGYDVFMMTPDKDYAQLVTDKVKMYKPARGGSDAEVLGIEEVKAKFGIDHPKQVIDILGLQGDSADNIPGCPGVGEKTASKLIKLYSSIEGLYENIDQLKGKQKEKVAANKEQVLLSKDLATIRLDAPYPFNGDEYKRKEVDLKELTPIFDELEFKTLLRRHAPNTAPALSSSKPTQMSLFDAFDEPSEAPAPSLKKQFSEDATFYHIIDTHVKRASLKAELSVAKAYAIHLVTDGDNAMSSQLSGISFSYKAGEGYYVPFNGMKDDEIKAILEEFNYVFSDENVTKVAFDLKHQLLLLKRFSCELTGPIFDLMVAHYLLQPDRKHDFDLLTDQYLNYQQQDIEAILGKKGKKQLAYADVKADQLKNPICEYTDLSLQLFNVLSEELKQAKAEELFNNLEMPLLRVLAEMEFDGVSLDVKGLNSYAEILKKDIDELEKRILEQAGEPFNVASPKQVGEVLFDKLKLDEKAKKTKSGQYSTSEEVLQKLASKHPIVEDILSYRGFKKLLSTYVEALPELVNPNTQKIHTSFNQAVAATGRLSSTNPNLQNIPIRDNAGREIRKCFIPSSEEFTFFSADYSQVELRLMAHLSQDKHMVEAFSKGEDIHAATAAKIYKVALDEVTSDMRRKAKTANFGIIYGISAFGLAERLNISRSEGKELITGYFESYADVKAFMDKCIAEARESGYVETLMGRKRYLADINSRNAIVRGVAERNAINAPIQGSAADIIKKAMIAIQNKLKALKMRSKMVLQVHDELNFNAHVDELEQLKAIVTQEMENAYQLSVPLLVETGEGKNWLEAH